MASDNGFSKKQFSDGVMLYKSHEFIDFCKKNSIIQSMSRPGNALDNRVIEYWFSIFKNEFLKHINTKKYSLNEFKLEVEKYIDYTITKGFKKSYCD